MDYIEIYWSLQSPYPPLTTLQLTTIGLALLLFLEERTETGQKIALAGAVISFGVLVDLCRRFDGSIDVMQFAEWGHMWGSFHYHSAVNETSVLILLMAILSLLLLVIYNFVSHTSLRNKELAAVFAIEACFIVQFSTMNLIFFFLATLVQFGMLAYLIKWRFTVPKTTYLFLGSLLLFLLVIIIKLSWNHAHTGDKFSFDLFDLALTPQPDSAPLTVFSIFMWFHSPDSSCSPDHI